MSFNWVQDFKLEFHDFMKHLSKIDTHK